MRIVTGMHRSGTSLVARLLHEAGADMGDPSTFHPADRWNPDGYFEQPDIHAVNMPLVNGRLWKFAYFRLPSAETILRRGDGMADLIRTTAARYAGKVVKETRFCLTLPAWRAHGLRADRVLVCLREPADVARSIVKRNHVPTSLALSLWREHNERILAATADLPVDWILYADLLDRERGPAECARALRFLGEERGAARAAELHARCVKPSMDHGARTRRPYPAAIAALWDDLRDRHRQASGAPRARVGGGATP